MSALKIDRFLLPVLMLLAGGVLTTGIKWGLPSREIDPYLFGNRTPWTGSEIVALAPPEKVDGGADVDANPIGDRSKPVLLNETDAQRAEIIRRYRLFSYQPDEMITLKSLAQIKRFRGDPRLYQYGGLWIYPVGALLKLGSIIGYIDLRSEQALYLDHPEAFGRFYIVARLYSAAWGVLGVAVVWGLARKVSSRPLAGVAGAMGFIFLPVVMNLSHEAKPHLAAAVLQLMAIGSAIHFVQTNRERYFWLSAVLCGAAFGMVLSAVWIFVILPFARLQVDVWRRAIGPVLLAVVLGLGIYCVTNPYVPINLLTDPRIVFSNLGNSGNMYHVSRAWDGLGNTLLLICEGTTTPLAIAGLIGMVIIFQKNRNIALVAFPPMLLVLVQMTLLGAGKPPEYARFAILIDVLLMLCGLFAVSRLPRRTAAIGSVAMIAWTCLGGGKYLAAFIQDSIIASTSRNVTAHLILRDHPKTLAVPREPAPYYLPPVDLFRTRLILMPENSESQRQHWDMIVWPKEALLPLSWTRTPMSWANAEFAIVSLSSASP